MEIEIQEGMSTQIVTMRRLAIIFFELGIVKHFMQKFHKALHDYFFLFKNCD